MGRKPPAQFGDMMQRKTNDLFLGLGIALAGGLIFWWLIPNAVMIPKTVKIASLSPAFWPNVLAGGMMLFGLIMAGNGFWAMRKQNANPDDNQDGSIKPQPNEGNDSGMMLKAVGAMAGMLVYYFLVEPFGIILASVIIFPSFALLYGEKRLKYLASLAVLLPVGLYYFFTVAAHKPMPTGYLF